MVRKTTKTGRAFIWLVPDNTTPTSKINILDDDGNTTDISTNTRNVMVKPGLNEKISSAIITIENNNGKFTGKWNTSEKVDIFIDYTSATNKVFLGYLDKTTYSFDENGRFLELFCRGAEAELLERFVNKVYINTSPEDIISDLVSTFAVNVTYTKIETKIIINKIRFREDTVWGAIVAVCKQVGHDVYTDTNQKIQHFAKNSVQNINEFITHGINLINCRVKQDRTKVKNKIRVTGGVADSSTDVIYLTTKDDEASQDKFGIREFPFSDTNLVSEDTITNSANTILSERKNLIKEGTVISLGLPTIIPGQQIRMSSPRDNLNDGFYRLTEVTHHFGNKYIVNVSFAEPRESLGRELNKIITIEKAIRLGNNPNAMINSKVFTFDENPSVFTHANTQENDSILELESGKSSGTATSETFVLTDNITSFEIRLDGKNLGTSTIRISNNGGINYTNMSVIRKEIDFSTTNKRLKVQVQLVSDAVNVNPQVFSMAILTK